jgi:phosphoglucomutase
MIMGLLAAEMTAAVGRDPGEQYAALTAEFGDPAYARIDAPATRAQKAVLSSLSASDVPATELAGDRIVATMTTTPYLDAPIGGLKVVTEHGWFAARPSGTEEVYKLYAESFRGADHLARIQREAQELIARAFAATSAT